MRSLDDDCQHSKNAQLVIKVCKSLAIHITLNVTCRTYQAPHIHENIKCYAALTRPTSLLLGRDSEKRADCLNSTLPAEVHADSNAGGSHDHGHDYCSHANKGESGAGARAGGT